MSGIGSVSSWDASAQQVSQFSRTGGQRSQSTSGSASSYTDIVDISELARQLAAEYVAASSRSADSFVNVADANSLTVVDAGSAMTLTSASGLRRYMNIGSGSGETSLTAMNMNRKALGGRIDSVLNAAGIKLGKNDKLSLSVDSKNNIVVSGIKDKGKLKAISEALNEDPKLGRELRKHVATGKISSYAQKQADYEKFQQEYGIEGTGRSEFDNPGMRALIMDEYLQEKAGISLSELGFEKGADGSVAIKGMNDELAALFEQDGELKGILAGMLEKGETNASFEVSLEYANGSISDSATAEAATEKLKGVKEALFGVLDEFRTRLEGAGGDYDEDFMQALSRGFSVRASASGEFELVGLEDLDSRLRNTLEGLLTKALDNWANEFNGKDPYTGGTRANNLGDVADAFIEQHRFEQGDVDEYKHMAEINFAGNVSDVTVVSPEADKAQDAANQAVADQLGSKLKDMLEDEDVDTAGMEFEINESGKITVAGNPDDPNVKKAQSIIDQFVIDTKKQAAPAEEEEDDEKEGDVSEDLAASNMVASSEDGTRAAKYKKLHDETFEQLKEYLPDGAHLNTAANVETLGKFVGWENSARKAAEGVQNGAFSKRVSTVKPAGFAPEGGEYADDAAGLYGKLMDGMGQFHDGRKNVSYKFKAA